MTADNVVERLAKTQAERFSVRVTTARRNDARWWLNAIADELEQATGRVAAATWLRTQAEETTL